MLSNIRLLILPLVILISLLACGDGTPNSTPDSSGTPPEERKAPTESARQQSPSERRPLADRLSNWKYTESETRFGKAWGYSVPDYLKTHNSHREARIYALCVPSSSGKNVSVAISAQSNLVGDAEKRIEVAWSFDNSPSTSELWTTDGSFYSIIYPDNTSTFMQALRTSQRLVIAFDIDGRMHEIGFLTDGALNVFGALSSCGED